MVASSLGGVFLRFLGVSVSRRAPFTSWNLNKNITVSQSRRLCLRGRIGAPFGHPTLVKTKHKVLIGVGGSRGLKSFGHLTESRGGLSVGASVNPQGREGKVVAEVPPLVGKQAKKRHIKGGGGDSEVVIEETDSGKLFRGGSRREFVEKKEPYSASWEIMSQREAGRGGVNVEGEGGKVPQGLGVDDPATKRRRMNDGGVQAREGPGDEQEGGAYEKGKGKKKRGRLGRAPPNEFIRAIHLAAKFCDRNAAMAAFRGAKASGFQLNQDTMNSLLYILVGGDKWSDHARSACEKVLGKERVESVEEGEAAKEPEGETPQGAIAGQDDFRKEVFEYMEEGKMMNSEMAFTAQARLAACHGDAAQAFEFVEKMLSQKIPGKLRMFTPALVCYATLGNTEGALRVEKRILEENLDLTELEFRLLLEACATSGTYTQFATILASIGKERTFLEESTVEHIIRYFKSDRAEEAFAEGADLHGKEMWAVKHVDVLPDGYSDLAGGKLATIDLEDADWDKFLDGVKQIALEREKNNAFSPYLEWLGRHGPFDIIVDGANVAMHGQNFEGSYFRFNQIECLMQMLATEFPQRRALVILHVGRLHGAPAKSPEAQLLVNRLRNSGQLYSTPVGSNDDWYWLYAAIKARGNGLVVSNDECRDHIFQLLAPKYFLKWKERHLVRFGFHKDRFKGLSADIRLPAPYTPCTQQLFNGTWMIPCVGGKWLCVKPL